MYCGGNCQSDFDLAMWDWFPAADPDFILAVLTCDEWGNWNDTAYCSEAYDDLYHQQKGERSIRNASRSSSRCNRWPSTIDRTSSSPTTSGWTPGRRSGTDFVESTQGIYNNFSTQSLTSVHQT